MSPDPAFRRLDGSDTTLNETVPPWCERGQTTSGEPLMRVGVPLPVLPPRQALLIGCFAADAAEEGR